jgi:hypothetical protein
MRRPSRSSRTPITFLCCPQDALILSFAVNHALRRLLGRSEHGLHDEARLPDEFGQTFAIRRKILDGSGRDAAFHCRFGHGRRDGRNQTGIEWPWNDVIRAEAILLPSIGCDDNLGLLGMREFCKRLDGSQFHFERNSSRTRVESAAKYERKAQHVVHLIRKIRSSGCNDGIRTHGTCDVWEDFRHRICQREDQRPLRHLLDHLGLEHAACGEPQKYIGAEDHVGERTRLRLAGVACLEGIHLDRAALVHNPCDVGHPDVVRFDPHADEQIQTRQRRRAGT